MSKTNKLAKCFSDELSKNMSKYYYKGLHSRNGKVIKNHSQAIAISMTKAENACYKTARYALIDDQYYRIIGNKFKYKGKYINKKDPLVEKIIFKKKSVKVS
jgi:hypothetical protein